jgi:hypothetical protein
VVAAACTTYASVWRARLLIPFAAVSYGILGSILFQQSMPASQMVLDSTTLPRGAVRHVVLLTERSLVLLRRNKRFEIAFAAPTTEVSATSRGPWVRPRVVRLQWEAGRAPTLWFPREWREEAASLRDALLNSEPAS